MPAALEYTIEMDNDQAVNALKVFINVTNQADAGLGKMEKSSLGLGSALAGLGAGAGLMAIIRQGFEFNQTMRDSEAAIGQVLGQMAGLNKEAAKNEAARAMQLLIDLEPKAAGGLTDLVGGFMASVSACQMAGLTLEQNIDLVGLFSNALANAAIPADQLAQEMRSILTANIGVDSTLAKVLGITNEAAKAALEAGNMYEFLRGKIGQMGEAGDTAGVAFSTLKSALQKAAGALTAGLFDQAVAGSKDLNEQMNELQPTLIRVGQGISHIVSWLGDAAAAAFKVADMCALIAATLGAAIDDPTAPLLEHWQAATDAMAEVRAEEEKTRAQLERPYQPKAAPKTDTQKAIDSIFAGEDAAAQAGPGPGAASPGGGAKSSGGRSAEEQALYDANTAEMKRQDIAEAYRKEAAEAQAKASEAIWKQPAPKAAMPGGSTSARPQVFQGTAPRNSGGTDLDEGKIQGYSFQRQGGRDAARLRAQQRGAGIDPAAASAAAVDSLRRTTNPNAVPVGPRVQQAAASAAAGPVASGTASPQADPSLAKLDAIIAELKRLKTDTA